MVIVVPISQRLKGQPLRALLWRLAHKLSIFGPGAVGAGYGLVLGLAAQATRGTDARVFFDNQIVMWRAIVLAPYGLFWFLAFIVLWLAVVIWTGARMHAAEQTDRPRPAASQERKQALFSRPVRTDGKAQTIREAHEALLNAGAHKSAYGTFEGTDAQRLNPILKSAILSIQRDFKLRIPVDTDDWALNIYRRVEYLEQVLPFLEGGHIFEAKVRASELAKPF